MNRESAVVPGAGVKSSFFESEAERSAFPNICRFLSAHVSSAQLPAEIDVVRFFGDRPPEFERDIHSLASRETPATRDATAELFIIEAVDPVVVEYFLRNRVGPNRTLFLEFLEDFLDDYPSYNFDDVQNHFPSRQSATARQRHVCFQVTSIREFDRPLELDRNRLQEAIRANRRTWKDVRLHGPFIPAQRKESGRTTAFPPGVLSRNHFAAWFDGDMDHRWQTGTLSFPYLPI
jgi:hypothetical protein